MTGGASLATQIVAAVISSAGTYAVNGVVQSNFTENVSATVTYTKTKYTNVNGGGTGSIFDGKKAHIKTRNSQYYNQTFFEGDAPERYSTNAYKACLNTYTGGGNYTFNKMLSFN